MLMLREPIGRYDRSLTGPRHEFVLLVEGAGASGPGLPAADLPAGARVVASPLAGGRVCVYWPGSTRVAAVVAAVQHLERAGCRVWRVDAGDMVTLTVIAGRAQRSRETVRLWSLGSLGPGGFPPPLNPGASTALYSWAEVRRWLRIRLNVDLPADRADDDALVAADLALRLRRIADWLPDPAPVWELLMPP
ncbi:hypothetical protein [Pilimelia columellifera]|uniref:Uncharacterized protein n=1 Tax=Pilimelia columellifera subsp. columellifera TaxID=706583 RepID=A0ABN3NNK5_9ACTN